MRLLCARIPREEVEEMGRVVMKELDEFEPGCVSTIAGGYDLFICVSVGVPDLLTAQLPSRKTGEQRR